MRYGQDVGVVEKWPATRFAEACELIEMEAKARKRAEFKAKHSRG